MYTKDELLEKGFTEEQAELLINSEVRNVTSPEYNATTEPSVTTLADLQSYAKGSIVRFPDFADGQPLVARVKRPSMLALAKAGKIPNSLLTSAAQLFTKGGGGMDSEDEKMLAELYDVCEVIVNAALIEPTLKDIKEAGLELSDNQLMAIFNYTQNGIKALDSFR